MVKKKVKLANARNIKNSRASVTYCSYHLDCFDYNLQMPLFRVDTCMNIYAGNVYMCTKKMASIANPIQGLYSTSV